MSVILMSIKGPHDNSLKIHSLKTRNGFFMCLALNFSVKCLSIVDKPGKNVHFFRIQKKKPYQL